MHEYIQLIVGMLRHVFLWLLQAQSAFDTMPKKGKKKAKVTEEETDVKSRLG